MNNFFSLGIIQVAAYALPLLTLPYVLRTIGVEKYGILAVANALTAYFVLLTDYGFRISATREVSIHRSDSRKLAEIFSSVLTIKLCVMAVSLLVLGIVLALNEKFRSFGMVQLFSFGLVPANVLTLTWFFQGMERMKYITVLSLLSKLAYTVSLFVFVHKPEDYTWIPLLGSGSEILGGLIGLVLVFTHFKVRPVLPTLRELTHQIRQGWHVFVSTIAINAYSTTPTFALGLFAGTTAAGYYSVAERMSQIYQTFPLGSLLQALYPRLSNMYASKPKESYRMMASAQKYTTIFYIATFPVLLLLTPIAVSLLAGKLVEEAAICFGLMAAAVVVINANAFRLQFLLVAGEQKIYAKIHLFVGILGSLLVFGGAYLFGYTGPPVALIVTNLIVLAWTIKAVRSISKQTVGVTA